ncbi:MAG: FmdB family zinc ribbon protein [Candidatus Aminicenantales bacterium]
MPIYEFLCKQCRCHFETIVRMGGEKGVVCPECGSAEIEKLFSTFGIGNAGSRSSSASPSAGSSSSGSSACASCSSRSCSTCR